MVFALALRFLAHWKTLLAISRNFSDSISDRIYKQPPLGLERQLLTSKRIFSEQGGGDADAVGKRIGEGRYIQVADLLRNDLDRLVGGFEQMRCV